MTLLSRTLTIGAFALVSSLNLASGAFAESAMAASPMAADPMAAQAAMDKCHTEAKAETDATKMKTMMDACDAMAAPMAPDAMSATPMASGGMMATTPKK